MFLDFRAKQSLEEVQVWRPPPTPGTRLPQCCLRLFLDRWFSWRYWVIPSLTLTSHFLGLKSNFKHLYILFTFPLQKKREKKKSPDPTEAAVWLRWLPAEGQPLIRRSGAGGEILFPLKFQAILVRSHSDWYANILGESRLEVNAKNLKSILTRIGLLRNFY